MSVNTCQQLMSATKIGSKDRLWKKQMKRDSNHTIEPLAPSLVIFVIRGREKRSSTEFSCLPSIVERRDPQFQFHCIVRLLWRHPSCLRSSPLKRKEELKLWEPNCGQHRMILDSPTRTRPGLFCVPFCSWTWWFWWGLSFHTFLSFHRNCYTNYLDYHRCRKVKGENYEPCEYFKKVYMDLCPSDWVSFEWSLVLHTLINHLLLSFSFLYV